jgi:hypothetical protein
MTDKDRDREIQRYFDALDAFDGATPQIDYDADVELYQQVFMTLALPSTAVLPDAAFATRVMAAIAAQQLSLHLSLRERFELLSGIVLAVLAALLLLAGLVQLGPVLEFDMGLEGGLQFLGGFAMLWQNVMPALGGLAAGALVLGLDKGRHIMLARVRENSRRCR